nr:decaprenyl-phosphate phosphoribosyltransferase [uncultured Dyadobacter sp.]
MGYHVHLILKQIRVHQWIKNLLIFAPLLFSGKLFNPDSVLSSLLAFLAFSFAASATYVLNDIKDVKSDRNHPVKRNRPLASGKLSMNTAIASAVTCILASIATMVIIDDIKFALILVAYSVVNVLYSLYLKNISIVDCIIISIGFELRILAGCEAIQVSPSDFILVVTFFLALMLGFIKRKGELKVLDQNAHGHRSVLASYSVKLMDTYIHSCTTMTLISYMFYTIDSDVIRIIGSDILKYSLIFVVYGLFRFIQLTDIDKYQGEGDPTTLIYKDKALQLTIVLFLAYIIFCFYGGHAGLL